MLFGIREANGDPVKAVKCTEEKFRTLVGRELNAVEVLNIKAAVVAIHERLKWSALHGCAAKSLTRKKMCEP